MYPSCDNFTDAARELSICNPSKLNETELEQPLFDEDLERIVSLTVFVLFGFIFVAGLIGNALVVIVVAFNPLMRSTTNILIINLAISDLMFVIMCIPFTASDYILPNWPFGDLMCKIVQYMIVVTCLGSVYTLVLMSLDRFLAVVHPISSMSIRTERNALIATLLAWFFIFTTAIPTAICHGEDTYMHKGENRTACLFLVEQGYNHSLFQISFLLSSYVIPLSLISFLYVGMLSRLWSSNAVVAFSICWAPIQIILVLKSLRLYETTTLTVSIQIISHVLAYLNSCLNPFLYAFLSENFRKAFRKVMWCGPTSSHYILAAPDTTKSTRTGTRHTGNGAASVDIL
ncbi:CLUMA_CG015406, isoform A [Clunio marinus]|uniref:CLUMA_CG015406, isoform A n=1 Tax=Clunio marinus TaxID=568069 RepID=A0A1J1IT53_9DIPT|nr:CLUMA_CG015406, isoform A [Clunio marinus]